MAFLASGCTVHTWWWPARWCSDVNLYIQKVGGITAQSCGPACSWLQWGSHTQGQVCLPQNEPLHAPCITAHNSLYSITLYYHAITLSQAYSRLGRHEHAVLHLMFGHSKAPVAYPCISKCMPTASAALQANLLLTSAHSLCCCRRHFTKAQAQYGAYFHKVLFSGTLQRQQHTKVTLRRVTFNALDKLLMHQQAPGGTSSPSLPSQYTAATESTFFLCVYAASHIVRHGVAAV